MTCKDAMRASIALIALYTLLVAVLALPIDRSKPYSRQEVADGNMIARETVDAVVDVPERRDSELSGRSAAGDLSPQEVRGRLDKLKGQMDAVLGKLGLDANGQPVKKQGKKK